MAHLLTIHATSTTIATQYRAGNVGKGQVSGKPAMLNAAFFIYFYYIYYKKMHRTRSLLSAFHSPSPLCVRLCLLSLRASLDVS
jgi:hypothetical protein